MQLQSFTPKKVPSASPSNRFLNKSDVGPAKSTHEVNKIRDIPKTGTSYDQAEKQIVDNAELLPNSQEFDQQRGNTGGFKLNEQIEGVSNLLADEDMSEQEYATNASRQSKHSAFLGNKKNS